MSYYTQQELTALHFRHLGVNVRISKKASLYGVSNISIGDGSRIDDFCILSAGEAGICIGRYVHIACYVSLIGKGLIDVGDFAGISGRSSVYSSNDDYSGNYLTGPQIDPAFTNVASAPVRIGKHVVLGAGSVVLPNVSIGTGAATGAMTLVTRNIGDFEIHVGSPARFVKKRAQRLLELETAFLAGKQADL